MTLHKGKPSQANLRRAVSSVYYAIFHALARCCADTVIGGAGASKSAEAWRQAYRALEHGSTLSACKNKEMIAKFPDKIQDFANSFVTMQEERHKADYDPMPYFLKSEVKNYIQIAELVIRDFQKLPRKHRAAFCAYVLFQKRKRT